MQCVDASVTTALAGCENRKKSNDVDFEATTAGKPSAKVSHTIKAQIPPKEQAPQDPYAEESSNDGHGLEPCLSFFLKDYSAHKDKNSPSWTFCKHQERGIQRRTVCPSFTSLLEHNTTNRESTNEPVKDKSNPLITPWTKEALHAFQHSLGASEMLWTNPSNILLPQFEPSLLLPKSFANITNKPPPPSLVAKQATSTKISPLAAANMLAFANNRIAPNFQANHPDDQCAEATPMLSC
jgi:hypothetical protein